MSGGVLPDKAPAVEVGRWRGASLAAELYFGAQAVRLITYEHGRDNIGG